MSERSRALEYQAAEKRREAYEKALAASLAGDKAALAELKANWAPITDPPEKIL